MKNAGILFALVFGSAFVNAATFTVTSNGNSGVGTLSQAILDANATAGADRIEFNLAANRRTITLIDNLPEITETVVLDGTTQPNFAGTPIITIAGTVNASAPRTRLLRLTTTGSTIKGLIFNNLNQNDSGQRS